jgi:transposase
MSSGPAPSGWCWTRARQSRPSRELDLTPSSLANWVKHARADRTKGKTGLTTEERAELASLRKENRELRTEREILKKAAAFFAKHQQ